MTRRGGGEDQLQSLAVRRRLCRVVESENEKRKERRITGSGGGWGTQREEAHAHHLLHYGVRSTEYLTCFSLFLREGAQILGRALSSGWLQAFIINSVSPLLLLLLLRLRLRLQLQRS
jgi:hypothetical protein